jgi:hypothetical protein
MQLQGPPQQPTPPTTTEDLNQRINGWDRFLEKLAGDEAFRSGLMKFGTDLLQPRTGGQTSAGAIGQAIQAGTQETRGLRAQAREEQRLDDEQQRLRDQTDANIDTQRAQAASMRSSTQRAEQLQGLTIERLQEELTSLQAQNDPEFRQMVQDEIQSRTALNTARARLADRGVGVGNTATPNRGIEEVEDMAADLISLNPNLSKPQAKVRARQFLELGSRMSTPEDYQNALDEALASDLLSTEEELAQKKSENARRVEAYRKMYERVTMLETGPQDIRAPLTPEQQADFNQAVENYTAANGPPSEEVLRQLEERARLR